MRVSPLDIRKQEFNRRTFGGYEPEEVNSFLQMLSSEWEEMRDDHRRLEEQVRSLEEKIRHYERVEEALQEALQTARDSSRKTVENAEDQARAIVATAEAEALRIKQDAVSERNSLTSDVERLHHQRRELVARLRGFLSSELEMLEQFAANGRRMTSPSGRRESAADVRRAAPAPAPVRRPEPVKPAPEPETPEPAAGEYDDEFDVRTDATLYEAPPNKAASDYSAEERHQAEQQSDVEEHEPTADTGSPFSVSRFVRGPQADDFDTADDEEGDIIDNWPEEEASSEQEQADEWEPAETSEERKAREATEEIAKIRRILNDLD